MTVTSVTDKLSGGVRHSSIGALNATANAIKETQRLGVFGYLLTFVPSCPDVLCGNFSANTSNEVKQNLLTRLS